MTVSELFRGLLTQKGGRVASSRDQIISKMDAFVEGPCEALMLRKMMHLYLYCFVTERFLSSLPLVYLFFSLHFCLGCHQVSWSPFLTVDCCLPAKRAVLTENIKDGVSLCVIEVTFQVGIFCSCHVITVLVKTAFFFLMNSFHMIFIFKTSQIHPDEVEDDNEVMLISNFNVDEIKRYH